MRNYFSMDYANINVMMLSNVYDKSIKTTLSSASSVWSRELN